MGLRHGLRSAGVPLREINVWSDSDAASYVRSVTGGDQTEPTVVVADRVMVNPSTRHVLAAVASKAPHL